MSHRLQVRPFAPQDLDAIFLVRRDSIRNVASRDYSPAQIAAWARHTDNHKEQLDRFVQTLTWIAEWDRRLVGYTNLRADGYLDCMYVHSAFQGRGIATALLRELEASARKAGLGRLHSEVSITARPFFERRGFVVTAAQRVASDGQEYDNFRMEKLL